MDRGIGRSDSLLTRGYLNTIALKSRLHFKQANLALKSQECNPQKRQPQQH